MIETDNDSLSSNRSQRDEGSFYDNEEDYDDGEEEESDGDEDLDEEPKLKYKRLGAGVRELLEKNTASTIRVTEKFVALGTHWGTVHVLDFEGNIVKSFQKHNATVNDISIDASEEFIASASDDGKVYIYSLYTSEIQHFDYRRPVKAVAIDPEYAHKKTRQFVSGGMAEQLIMNEKGWLGHQNMVLHANEGPIYSIQWKNQFIAWANDTGVKIYDTQSNLRITYIDRPSGSPRPDLYKCRMVWKDDTTLLIGWADTVKIAVVEEKPKHLQMQGQPNYYVKVISVVQTDYIISGIAPFEDMILTLGYVIEDDISSTDIDVQVPDYQQKRRLASRPELHILDQHTNEEVSVDVLPLNGYEHYQANDYALGFLMEEDMFYVMGPKDLFVAKPRGLDDHIEWLLEHEKYGEALNAARNAALSYGTTKDEDNNGIEIINGTKDLNVRDIGETYLNWLVKENKYEDAAKECKDILGDDKDAWEAWVFKFSEEGQLGAITKYIPIKNPQLSDTVYEMVLLWYMENDQKGLLDTIHKWPHDLYIISNIINAVEGYLANDQNNEILLEVLADLYDYNKRPDMAIEYNLRLRRPNAFEIIQEYNMFDAVKDKAVLLMEFDQHLLEKEEQKTDPATKKTSTKKATDMPAVQLLVKNHEAMQPAKIVRQLKSHPKFLHIYLDALFQRDHHIGAEFHDLQVELYADYDYPKLLDFLRSSQQLSLKKAYNVCEKKDLVPEMVFILGRMGDNKKALMLIINRMNDVQRAIDFAKEQMDDDLWEDLLTYSMDKPLFIKGLLENVGTDIEPLRLIKRIPDTLEIPELKAALLKILQDYNLQMSLHQGCEKILVTDSVFLADRMYKTQKRGIKCQRTMLCNICENPVFENDNLDDFPNTIIFFCRHAYHEKCLQEKVDKYNDRLDNDDEDHATTIHPDALSTKINHSALLKSTSQMVCPLCQEQVAGGNAFMNRMKSQRKIFPPKRSNTASSERNIGMAY
ncbi:unnamed protein product [Cunninghamella blakesleeana]